MNNDSGDELEDLLKEYESKSKNLPIKTSKQTTKRATIGISGNGDAISDKHTLIKNLSKSVANESDDEIGNSNGVETNGRKRGPAWSDSDDEELQLGEVKRRTKHTGSLKHMRLDQTYKEYLTTRFTKIVGQPKWSSINKEQFGKKQNKKGIDNDDIQQGVGFLSKKPLGGGGGLRKTTLQFKQLKDVNRSTYAEEPISSVEFHPTNAAALITGKNGVASIYCVDGQQNEKLHNMRFKNFKISCAKIAPCGTKAFFGALRSYYYKYDLVAAQETRLKLPGEVPSFHRFKISPCGRYIAGVGHLGAVHLFSTNTNELIHTFKQNDMVSDLCFTGDSHRLICNGKDNNVSIFSLRQQRMEHRFLDDGCIKGKVLDLSPNQRMLATGSAEGVVNVYDFEQVLMSNTPLPEKSFMNLTTEIAHIRFNHSSEMLAMCSYSAPGAVKLAHFPSATVFANFPDFQARLGKVKIVEFSPMSGYLATGNTHNKCALFRLKHFKNY